MEAYIHVLQKSLRMWWAEIIFLCEAADTLFVRRGGTAES